MAHSERNNRPDFRLRVFMLAFGLFTSHALCFAGEDLVSETCTKKEVGEDVGDSSCGCSGFSRDGIETQTNAKGGESVVAQPTSKSHKVGRTVALEGGKFWMGTDWWPHPDDREGPKRKVHVEPFEIDETEVTNEEFAEFVKSTGFLTDAEKYDWSMVYEPLLSPEVSSQIFQAVQGSEWWLPVKGAYWRAPEGPDSDVFSASESSSESSSNVHSPTFTARPLGDGRGDRTHHPAVHLSWYDAAAYCGWAGKRLPTEKEWEFAARGGSWGSSLPWGDSEDDLSRRANTFDGEDFPYAPQALKDGYFSTAPARSFPPNRFGLYNTVGNVWEWVADKWTDHPDETQYTQRGGSYMCHKSYCYRYRITSRTKNTPDSSAGHMGVRCARDIVTSID